MFDDDQVWIDGYRYHHSIMHTHNNGSGDDPGPPDLPTGPGQEVSSENKEEETDPRKPEQMKKQDPDEFLKKVFGPAERGEETESQKEQREFFFPHSKESDGKFNACQCGSASLGYDMGPMHSTWCPLYRKW
jgi:hypothetical protein